MPSHVVVTTLVSHHADASCRRYALFFHSLTPLWSLFVPVFFAIMASILTSWIRSMTPGITVAPKQPSIEVTPPTPSDDVEATAIPGLTATAESATEDQPPPYQPPAQETVTPVPTSTPLSSKVPSTSAGRFVKGSAIFLSLLTSLFISAVALQALIFCQHWSPVSLFPRIVYWAVFSIPCGWASVGASCWLMLLRDLWGPGMRKRFPISETAILFGLTCVVISPLILVGFVLGGLGGVVVKAIEACQRRFCGDALEEEREHSQESVELQEGASMEDQAESMERSGSGEEERVGLIAGVEK